jgi:hypothetical protein
MRFDLAEACAYLSSSADTGPLGSFHMNLEEFKPVRYEFRGKVRGLGGTHTALAKSVGLITTIGTLSFDKHAAFLRANDGRTWKFDRIFDTTGLSRLGEPREIGRTWKFDNDTIVRPVEA